MKRYIRSSKQFYSTDGHLVDVDRETRTLTYKYSYDGDYFNGAYHTHVMFEDSNGSKCLIQKILDGTVNPDNPYDLEENKSYQVSGYYVPVESSVIGSHTYYVIKNPRIFGIQRTDGKEMVLKFTYNPAFVEDAKRLCSELDRNNIEYKCYNIDDAGYPIQFNILRSGKTWNDIMHIVNSIRPARYKQEKLKVIRDNGKLRFQDW